MKIYSVWIASNWKKAEGLVAHNRSQTQAKLEACGIQEFGTWYRDFVKKGDQTGEASVCDMTGFDDLTTNFGVNPATGMKQKCRSDATDAASGKLKVRTGSGLNAGEIWYAGWTSCGCMIYLNSYALASAKRPSRTGGAWTC